MSIEDRISSLESKIRDLKSELEDAKREDVSSFCDSDRGTFVCYGGSQVTFGNCNSCIDISNGRVTVNGCQVKGKNGHYSFGNRRIEIKVIADSEHGVQVCGTGNSVNIEGSGKVISVSGTGATVNHR